MTASRLRKIAETATYEADAEQREKEERKRQLQAERDQLVREQSLTFLAAAKRKINRLFDVSLEGWEVVYSGPGIAALRDNNDKEYHKLTLSVIKDGNKLVVHYQPYDSYGKDYTHNRQGDGLDWHCGPVVTDALSLGRAIQAHREHDRKIYASMPDHLP